MNNSTKDCQGWSVGNCDSNLLTVFYTYEDEEGILTLCEGCRDLLEGSNGTWYPEEGNN